MPKKVLILIDFENEWITPGSEYFLGDISGLIERTNRLIDHCRKQGYKIIFTRHVEKDDDAFREGTKNSELIKELHKEKNDIVITKHRISPFYKTSLEEELKGIGELAICGILTNLCVRSAVHDAYDRDFGITVIEDCCISFDKKTQKFTFKDIMATRPEVRFTLLDNFLTA